MIEKQIVTGLVTINEDMILQVREDTVIFEDGVEISRVYNRYVAFPGVDVSSRSSIVQRLANLLWTPEVVEAWKIKDEATKHNLPRIS